MHQTLESKNPDHPSDASPSRARTYGNSGLPPAKKGTLWLTRLNVHVRFESLIEEQLLWCLDADLTVLKVDRSSPVTFHDVEGIPHTYTADFSVVRESETGNLIHTVYECKPADILRNIIKNDVLGWQMKQAKLQGDQQALWVVTDRDLQGPRLDHAQAFGPYFNSVADPDFRSRLLAELQRGRLSQQELIGRIQLRIAASLQTPTWHLQLYNTLHALIARGEIHADISFQPDNKCHLWLGSMAQPTQMAPLGFDISHYIQKSLAGWDEAIPPEPILVEDQYHRLAERKLLDSERGQKYLELFSIYNDPRQPLTAELTADLRSKTGFSDRALYRFKNRLLNAGAPGITFQQLVPHLQIEHRIPSNTVDQAVKFVIEAFIDSHYLKPIGFESRCRSVRNLYSLIRKRCKELFIPPPAQTTVQRFLNARYAQDPVGYTTARDGIEEASKLVGRQGHAASTCYGEVLGIDCTPCDVFIRVGEAELTVHKKGKAGKAIIDATKARMGATERATMIMITEESTSEIVLSYLVRGSASAAVILDGLRRVMLGDHDNERAAGVTHFSSFIGLPGKIRMDSGKEFDNRHVKTVLQTLGITVVSRNKGTRHLGGLEERTIGTLVHTHHILPGTTMHTIEARREYKAKKGATLNLETLAEYHHLNVEQHNLDCAPRRGVSRLEHAKNLIQQGQIRIRQPGPKQQRYLLEQMLPTERRVCGREGIQLFGLRYVSQTPEMEHLIRQKAMVDLVYAPSDLRTIQLIHPITSQLLTLQSIQYPGLDFGIPLSKPTWDLFRQALTVKRMGIKDQKETPQSILDRIRVRQCSNGQDSGAPKGTPNQVLSPAAMPLDQEIDDDIPVSEIRFIPITRMTPN